MMYIVYIKTQFNYYKINFIDKERVELISEAILNEQKDLFIDGKKFFINHLLEIRIFETENEKNYKESIDNSGIKFDYDYENIDGQTKMYIKPDILKRIIKEVTTEFINNIDINKKRVQITKPLLPSIDVKSKEIFISHSSKDKILIDKFVEKIFILGLGLSKENIFCTSTEGFGIKTGDDFRATIKKNISESKITFLIISSNYKKSEICLNEMGAAWVLNSHVIPIIIDPIDYKSVGVIIEPLQIAKLNDSTFLDELSQLILKTFNKIDFDIVSWNKHKQEFIDYTNSYIQLLKTSNDRFPNDFFEQFLINNIDTNQILIEAHPTLLDCQRLFTEKYSTEAFMKYCDFFSQLNNDKTLKLGEKYTTYKITTASIFELMNGNSFFKAGTVECAKNNLFNIDQKIYQVDFLEEEDAKSGYSFEVFTFYNNRVVFFPKPHRLDLIK